MTDQQINAAITEAIDADPHWKCAKDYCTNLNAMHEAEQHLWQKDWFMRYDYIDELGKLQNPHNWQRMEASDMLDATARQRAEAFLRTLGKWDQSGDATEMMEVQK
jgi:hypothetical protein